MHSNEADQHLSTATLWNHLHASRCHSLNRFRHTFTTFSSTLSYPSQVHSFPFSSYPTCSSFSHPTPSHNLIGYHFTFFLLAFPLFLSCLFSSPLCLPATLSTAPPPLLFPFLSCPSSRPAVITVDSEISSFFIESVNDMWHSQWF